MNHPNSSCGRCGKTKSEAVLPFTACGRCAQAYCSRKCKKNDRKKHQSSCSAKHADTTSSEPTPRSQQKAAPGPTLQVQIRRPYHKLIEGAWLRERSESDVFRLLLDTYRLRMQDLYQYEHTVESDSIYHGRGNKDASGFLRFLGLVAQDSRLLPGWWSTSKGRQYLEFARMENRSFGGLDYMIDESEIQRLYQDEGMVLQLRVFAEQVYGEAVNGLELGRDLHKNLVKEFKAGTN